MPSAEFRGRLAGAARGSGGSTRWRSICPPFDARWRRPKAPVGLRPEFVWSFAGIVATRLGWPTGGPSGEHVPVGHPADRSSRQHRTRRHRAGEKKKSALASLQLQPSPEGHASAGVRHGRHHRRDDDGRGKKDRDGQPVIFLWCLQLPPLSRAAGGHVGPILSSNSATTVPAKNRSPTETPSQANTQTAVRIHSRILTPVWRHGSTVGALAAMVAVLLIAVMA